MQRRFVHASYDADYTLSLVLNCLYDYVYEQRITKPNENNENHRPEFPSSEI